MNDRKMRKRIKKLLGIIYLNLITFQIVFAQVGENIFACSVIAAVSWIGFLGFVASAGAFGLGAIVLITSGGAPEQIQRGKSLILWGLIGGGLAGVAHLLARTWIQMC